MKQNVFSKEQAARLKKMEEEEKRKKAEFRKKVRLNLELMLGLFVGFTPPSSLLFISTSRWKRRCQILSRIVHNKKENTNPWGRLKGVYCKLLLNINQAFILVKKE